MDNTLNQDNSSAKRGSGTTTQIIAFATAAAVTAAAVGVATYVYLQRRASATPQHLLDRCRDAIDQIERSLELAHA